jgi:flagellar basal-body rod modification protein FlgD
MTETTLPLAGTTSVLPTGSSSSASTSKASDLTADFETFLLMLTTQAQNQDPLEPMDSSEYAAQLAQFSMVEQQVLSNDNLSALISQINLQTASSMSSWLGKEVRAPTPAAFEGTAITLIPSFEVGADSAELVVTDAGGLEVARSAVDPNATSLTWNGLDKNGNTLPNGTYTLEIESFSGGEAIGTTNPEFYARVTEAQMTGSTVQLVLESGQVLSAETVTAIRS